MIFRSACRRKWSRELNTGGREGRVTWCGEGGALLAWLLHWQCCGGGQWRCRGSRTTAPSSGACCSSGGEREISSSSPLLWFFRFFFLCFVYPWLSFCPLGFVLKKLPSPVSSFPLLFPFSLYSISLCGSFSPPFGLFCFPLCFCFFLCLFLFCPILFRVLAFGSYL